MNTTRILTTLAAAAALTGGIGFAYAQTAAGQAPASTNSTQTAAPSTGTASMNGTPSTAPSSNGTSMPASTSTDSTTAPTEPTPKADRG